MKHFYSEVEVDGEEGWVPSAYWLEILEGFGFCVACTQDHEDVAPEAVKLKCISCGQNKVFGTAFFRR
jgi:hypothetical protein